jgi:hypothetical protein
MKRGRFEFRARPSRPAPPGLMPTTRHLWIAIDDAARSTEQHFLPSGPVTELTDPPALDLGGSVADLEPRSSESPAPPRSGAKMPQRTTTLASSPAVDAKLTARQRQPEVIKVDVTGAKPTPDRDPSKR